MDKQSMRLFLNLSWISKRHADQWVTFWSISNRYRTNRFLRPRQSLIRQFWWSGMILRTDHTKQTNQSTFAIPPSNVKPSHLAACLNSELPLALLKKLGCDLCVTYSWYTNLIRLLPCIILVSSIGHGHQRWNMSHLISVTTINDTIRSPKWPERLRKWLPRSVTYFGVSFTWIVPGSNDICMYIYIYI